MNLIVQKVRYWQIMLNLTDWTIDVKLVPLKEIVKGAQTDAFAYIVYRYLTKTATIYLPNDLTIQQIAGCPVNDFLIVHELLHLIVYPLKNWYDAILPIAVKHKKLNEIFDVAYDEETEIMINHLTKVLVKFSMYLAMKTGEVERNEEEKDKQN